MTTKAKTYLLLGWIWLVWRSALQRRHWRCGECSRPFTPATFAESTSKMQTIGFVCL